MAPILATMKEPIPTVSIFAFGFVNLLFAYFIELSPKQEEHIEQTLMSILGGENTMGNMSMFVVKE
jgi:hypothetical protein